MQLEPGSLLAHYRIATAIGAGGMGEVYRAIVSEKESDDPAARLARSPRTPANALRSYRVVPEICRFFGIVITMFHDEHPPPHFHARYGGQSITVDIADGRIRGKLPPRAVGLILEWWSLHQSELMQNWERVNEGVRPEKIRPLE